MISRSRREYAARCESAKPQTPRKPIESGVHRRSLLGLVPTICCCGCGGGGGASGGSGGASGGDGGNASRAPRNPTLDRLFAKAMATGMDEYEQRILPVKNRLFAQLAPADGRPATPARRLEVLEIGAGTGPNLAFYPPNTTHITAVDPNPSMRPYMEVNMRALGWKTGEGVRWAEGVAEALPLPDASVDAVVCTLVLCSVEDVAGAVREAARVLRPGGRFLFIEHTAAQRGGLLRLGQAVLNPLQVWLADGCHLIRDPLAAIEGAGFAGGVEAMRFEVEGMGLIGPHVAGIAVK